LLAKEPPGKLLRTHTLMAAPVGCDSGESSLQTKFGFTPERIVEAAKDQRRLVREQGAGRTQ
jgi:hypothetical protein